MRSLESVVINPKRIYTQWVDDELFQELTARANEMMEYIQFFKLTLGAIRNDGIHPSFQVFKSLLQELFEMMEYIQVFKFSRVYCRSYTT